MSAEIFDTIEEENIDAQKRAFLNKFGKYAAVGAGMAILMSPSASHAVGSCANNGVGTGCKPHPQGKSHQNGKW